VLAPGVLIYGLSAPDYTYGPVLGYTYWDGTSMASPIFAGSLAMLWRFAPSLTNAEITDYMLKSATPDVANTAQPNTSYGYGYMNVAGAYAKLKADFPYLARPSITTTQVAYASQNINLAWGSVTATRSVQYQVVRDAGVPTTQTTTALALSNAALSEGTHTVTVTPQSSYNWYDSASDTATYTFTVDRTAPTVSGISYASNLLSWNDGEGTATHTAQVHIDAAATQTISANSYAITPGTLADGSHTLYIAETDAVGNTSSIYSYAFNYVNPPLAPVLSPSYSCADAPYTLSWTADPTASYECVLNGGATSTVPGGSIALSLNQGSNSVQLRSVKGNLASAWVTSTVSFIPPRPAAPAISPIADAHTPNQAVSWTAVPYALSYEYRINGSAATGTTATTTVFSGLVEGSNIIEVRSLNYSGYSTSWASATVIYYPPLPGAPTLPTFPGVATPNVSLSWPIATYASSYDWRINGGSISNIAAASLSTGGLVEGANLVEVRSHNYSGTSAWSTQTVIYSPPLPAAPTLGSIADVSVPSASFSWTAVSYATSYDYQLNGGAVLSTTGTTAALSGLSQGPNVIQVRSRNYSGTSTGWGSATVIYRPPLPVAPAVPTIADVSLPSVTFSWSAVPYATSYEVSLNGADPQTVSSPSITLSGLIEGINSVEVRARDYSGIGPWSAASFSYNPPLPGVPVLPTLAGVSTPSVSFSWPAVSYASSYEYRLNGGGPISVAVTGATATNLVEGPNSIELRSRNYSGVSAWSVAKTVIYTPPLPAAPVIAPLADVSVSSVSFSWAAVPYATSYDYRLGSAGTVLSTATTGAMLSGLLEGANSVQLRSHNYAGSSAWTSVSVVYRPPLPVAPTLPTLAEVSAPSTSLSWASATYATSYDWRLNGGSITNTVTRTLALTGLSKGSNLVEVRSHNYSGTSGWASRSFSFVPPVPPAPAVNPSTNPVPGGVVVSWASAANAVSYEVETNGSASGVTTSALSTMVTSLVDGDNTIRVRAWNAYGDAGPWSDSLTVVKPVFYSLSSLASAPTVSYGGTGTSISANVRGSDGAPAVGVVLTVQYSYDAKIWSTLTTLNTDALGNANYAYQPSRIVYVRVSAAGNDHYLATTGPALRLLVSPSMGIPSTPAKVTHSRSFTIYGYLKPRHASGAKNVSLKIYRQVSGKWKLYKTVSAKNANYSSYTKYSVSTSVPYKGSWRVYAYYAGTSSFAAFTTGYRTFSAK
jgi:hypothetical protein